MLTEGIITHLLLLAWLRVQLLGHIQGPFGIDLELRPNIVDTRFEDWLELRGFGGVRDEHINGNAKYVVRFRPERVDLRSSRDVAGPGYDLGVCAGSFGLLLETGSCLL